MKMAIALILLAAALPLLGWGGSLLFHIWQFGSLFVWNDMAYTPLLAVTFPIERIYNRLNVQSHLAVFAYALLGSAIYALATALVLSPVLVYKARRPRCDSRP